MDLGLAQLPEPMMTTIKFTGVFDNDGLLKMIYQYLKDSNMEVHERAYKHKVPNPHGEEDELSWWAWKNVNWYLRTEYWMEFHTWGVHDIEVVKDGKKVTAQEGRVEIRISFAIVRDYGNRFSGSKFMEGLQKFYERFILFHYLDNIYEDQLYYHMFKLQRAIKEYLGMSTPTNASERRW